MTLTLRWKAPAGAAALTGLAEKDGVQRLETADFDSIGFMAMGRLEVLRIPVAARAGPGTLTIELLDSPLPLARETLVQWFGASAARIGDYFGSFPTREALI